jgi:ketosteroid isomerase-like protein
MAAETALMRKVAKAFEQSDLKPLFESVADDIVWKSGAAREGPFIFGGTYVGRLGVVEVTSRISTGYVFRQFSPKEIVSSGDIVWGLFDVAGDYVTARGRTRRPFRLEFAIRWRVQRGKIVEHQSFFDTHSLLQQQQNSTAAARFDRPAVF